MPLMPLMPLMLPGYSTNSIGDIPPLDAVPQLADLGYRSLAITPDHGLLDPFAPGLAADIDRWRAILDRHGMARVIETGARHLLDRKRKHEPTLVSPDPLARKRRVDFLLAAIDIAADIGAACVSLWSGVGRDAADDETFWNRLTAGLGPVLERAAERGVMIGFEPEPGMVIDSLARYSALQERLAWPEWLGLSLDLGHLECMGEWPLVSEVRPRVAQLVNVHLDDSLACRHDHLPRGDGDVDFPSLFAMLAAGGYAGGLHLELPRQRHRWLDTARESAVQLDRLLAPYRSP